MENKSTINKKIKSYSALAGTLIAAGTTANAQVVYHDEIPDATINSPGGVFMLDMDNDGTVDFALASDHGTYTAYGYPVQFDYAIIAPYAAANAIDTATTGGPQVHVTNDPINSANLWVDGSVANYQMLGYGFTAPSSFSAYNGGNFLGATDAYIGLRFQIAGVDHYGWVRVDVSPVANSITIKDWAYDGTAGTSILCGATATGIAETLSNNVNIFNANNNININMNNAAVEGTAVVTDVLGKQVATAAINNSTVVIPMSEAQAGIYFVTLTQGEARFTKKVIIK